MSDGVISSVSSGDCYPTIQRLLCYQVMHAPFADHDEAGDFAGDFDLRAMADLPFSTRRGRGDIDIGDVIDVEHPTDPPAPPDGDPTAPGDDTADPPGDPTDPPGGDPQSPVGGDVGGGEPGGGGPGGPIDIGID